MNVTHRTQGSIPVAQRLLGRHALGREQTMKRILAALILGLAILMPSAAYGADDAPDVTADQRVAPYVQPSIVYIATTWRAKIYDTFNDTFLREDEFAVQSACTGFVVTPNGYIATAGHCVLPADSKYGIDRREDMLATAAAWAASVDWFGDGATAAQNMPHARKNWKLVVPDSSDPSDRMKYPALTATVSWGADVSGLEAQDNRPARLIDQSNFNEGDSALLKITAENLNALPLATEKPEVGTPIQAVGYPQKVDLAVDDDYTPSFKPGTISSDKTVTGGTTPVFEVSAGVAPGMSGGPTVNNSGEVIGINSFGADADTEVFNFVRPIELLQEMLNREGAEASVSDTSNAYFKGLDAYFEGDKKTAVASLKSVIADQPANGTAKEYLTKAEDLPNPPPPRESGPSQGLITAIVGLILLIVTGVLAFVFAKRRKSQSASPTQSAAPPEPGPGQYPFLTPPAQEGDTRPLASQNGTPPPCHTCATQSPPGTKFCGNCGTALVTLRQ